MANLKQRNWWRNEAQTHHGEWPSPKRSPTHQATSVIPAVTSLSVPVFPRSSHAGDMAELHGWVHQWSTGEPMVQNGSSMLNKMVFTD